MAQAQAIIFGWMLLSGIALGILYTCLYIVRYCLSFKKSGEFVCDLIFAIATTALFLWFLDEFAYGEIRFFSVASVVIGFALVRLTMFLYVKKLCVWVHQALAKLYSRLKKIPPFHKILK